MTESDKKDYDVNTWFRLDEMREGYKVLFVK